MAASCALRAGSSEPPPATIPGSLPIELARPLEGRIAATAAVVVRPLDGCVAPTAAAVARHTALMMAEAGGALLPLPGVIPSEAASDAASLRSAASPSCKRDGRGRPAWVDPVRKPGHHQHQRGGSLPADILAGGGSGDDALCSPARSSASMAAVRESLTSAKGAGLGRCPQTMGAEGDNDLSPLRDRRDVRSSNRAQGGTAVASSAPGGGLLLEANCCSSGAVSAICTAQGWALAAAGRDGVRILSVAHRVRLAGANLLSFAGHLLFVCVSGFGISLCTRTLREPPSPLVDRYPPVTPPLPLTPAGVVPPPGMQRTHHTARQLPRTHSDGRRTGGLLRGPRRSCSSDCTAESSRPDPALRPAGGGRPLRVHRRCGAGQGRRHTKHQ